MLTKCPECDLQVSDKASFCPHCGYPFKQISRPYTSKRRKRLPNGFGQITELKGRNLRKPFRAMITIDKDSNGKPIQKLLKPEAYFATYNEAYEALLKYNKDPYLQASDITMNELFEKWLENYEASESRVNAIKTAWKYCHKIYDMPVASIKTRHVIFCLENGTMKGKYPTDNTRTIIKGVLRQMLDYAVAREYTDKNYAKDVAQSVIDKAKRQSRTNEHKAFSEEDLEYLWSKHGEVYADMVLLQCYTGFRPSEMLAIKLKDVDLENMFIRGGMKTEAGTNRLVPIHPAVREIAKKFYAMSEMRGEYLLSGVLTQLTYHAYAIKFVKLLPGHTPHDARKQFITMAKKYKVDEYAIKRIVGHVITDLTESVYTERGLDWLMEEICKIPMHE